MRLCLAAALVPMLLLAPPLAAQPGAPLTAADSVLVRRILVAEDRRAAGDAALDAGARHADPRIRALAWRARERITDPRFVRRDSAPPFATPPAPPRRWPEPAWRQRYRALAGQRDRCAALQSALADHAWPVRLHAAGLARASCAGDSALAATLRGWVDALPADVSQRAPGGVSWHAAAHGLVALARLRPADATPRLARLAGHDQWQLRAYAARAAAVLGDTARLRRLTRDPHPNVREAALTALAGLSGRADDTLYLAALDDEAPPVVLAAARALEGSPLPAVRAAADAALARWTARAHDPERDVRVALRRLAGRTEADEAAPAPALPPRAVALALGDTVRLRVTMAPESGGGSFVVRLRGDVAPIMAARILALANDGYYDGLTWHRVEPDFVIQGGSPGANEYVGHARYLRDELGTVPHARGTVGMSTRGHDTGDAQWFVNLKDNPRLNADYTVFAEVVEGIAVVDGVLEGDVIARVREESGGAGAEAGARPPSTMRPAVPPAPTSVAPNPRASAAAPLRLAVARLTHTHVHGLLGRPARGDVRIVGIHEPDTAVAARYAAQYGLDRALFFPSLEAMLDQARPEAVAAFGSIREHRGVVEAAAPRGIHVMVEKPLAVSLADAEHMAALARRHGIHLLTNYETTWYPSAYAAYDLVHRAGAVGPLRKIVVHDGHAGPQEIGVPGEFLAWLTDPRENGAGALTDFGCYGANLITWLMRGQAPTSVTAVLQQLKPAAPGSVYARVDDEATILLTYPEAQGVVQASWNWPVARKDMEIYGRTGYVLTPDAATVRLRTSPRPEGNAAAVPAERAVVPAARPAHLADPFAYFQAVVRGTARVDDADLSALANNVTVMRILDAAMRSARTGRTIRLEE